MKKPLIVGLSILLLVTASPSYAGKTIKFNNQKAGQLCKSPEVNLSVNLPTGAVLTCLKANSKAKPKWVQSKSRPLTPTVAPTPPIATPTPAPTPPIATPTPAPTPTPVNNQPAFTLSSSSETRAVNTAATGFTINSTGGAIASFAINATPPGMSFNTSTGALTGTPNTVAAATAYTITATNKSGTATQTFTLTVTAAVYAVGDTGPGGGLVYYYNAVGFNCGPTQSSTGSPSGGLCHYLEVAPSTWARSSDPTLRWAGGTYQSTAVTGIVDDSSANNSSPAIGLGYQNSLAIVAQGNDTTTAAGAARAYRGGSKSDWYLPDTAELNLLCQWDNGTAPSVGTACTGGSINSSTYGASAAGFVVGWYWSSSELVTDGAWGQYFGFGYQGFGGGAQGFDGKFNAFYVRPVRAF